MSILLRTNEPASLTATFATYPVYIITPLHRFVHYQNSITCSLAPYSCIISLFANIMSKKKGRKADRTVGRLIEPCHPQPKGHIQGQRPSDDHDHILPPSQSQIRAASSRHDRLKRSKTKWYSWHRLSISYWSRKSGELSFLTSIPIASVDAHSDIIIVIIFLLALVGAAWTQLRNSADLFTY